MADTKSAAMHLATWLQTTISELSNGRGVIDSFDILPFKPALPPPNIQCTQRHILASSLPFYEIFQI